MARFLPDATPDVAFRVGGAMTGINGTAVALQANGKIIVAGPSAVVPQPGTFVLWRLEKEGLLDTGFGNGGSVSTPLLDIAVPTDLAIQPDGRILAAGWTEPLIGGQPGAPQVALVRYFGD